MILQNQQHFDQYIDNILEKSKFNATYKLALLMAIAKICSKNQINNQEKFFVDYQVLADEFIEIYWNCTELYHKQTGETLILRHGINAGKDNIVHYLQELKNLANIQRIDMIDINNKHYREAIQEIIKLIKSNPVKFLQDSQDTPLFDTKNLDDKKINQGIELKENIGYFFGQNANTIIEKCKTKFAEVIFHNPKNNLADENFNRIYNFLFNK